MKQLQLMYHDGRYEVDIDISVEEWKAMLQNPSIFDQPSLDMVRKWYYETDHKATNQAIMAKYPSELKSTPYNGIVNGLTQRIVKYLNRFEVIGTKGKKSMFSVPFEGWYEDYNPYKHFVWKLRDELVQALEEIEMVDTNKISTEDDELTSYSIENIESKSEGKKRLVYTTIYERNPTNRRQAITIHGTVCQSCGFDFERTYGEIGKDFIEVHHVKPLSEEGGIVEVNPYTDLICVCANCHRMIHKRKDSLLSLTELQKLMKDQKKLSM
jgi:5-methylcytosine-specific restriction enzyme A